MTEPAAPLIPPVVGKGRAPVRWSNDLARVLAIPTREPPLADALVEVMNARLRRTDDAQCSCDPARGCIKSLRPVQAWALFEAPLAGGLIAPIGVGHGKTGIGILAPMVFPGVRKAVLVVTTGLVDQLVNYDYPAWSQHFVTPTLAGSRYLYPGRPILRIVPYAILQRPGSTDLLRREDPDLVIWDEGHRLKNHRAATWLRAQQFHRHKPRAIHLFMSGTFTQRSIRDWAHLSPLALGLRSPVPLHPPTVAEWATAVDPAPNPAPPGQLARLQSSPFEPLEVAFRRRVHSTMGVVHSGDAMSCQASLTLTPRCPEVPPEIVDALSVTRSKWQRPDGEELVDALTVSRCASELASGFYFRWRFPRGEPRDLIEEWLEVRKEWHCELREKIKRGGEHLDSPWYCLQAALRYYAGYQGPLPKWKAETWPAWRAIRAKVQPETETIWVSDFLVRDAVEWGRANVGIIWYDHVPFGEALAEASGFPFYGPGKRAAEGIIREKGDRTIIASITSHGEGRNLQMFQNQLVANVPAGAKVWEQLLGRTHRLGQRADEIGVTVYQHTPDLRDALDSAISYARWIEAIENTPQRLVAARLVTSDV